MERQEIATVEELNNLEFTIPSMSFSIGMITAAAYDIDAPVEVGDESVVITERKDNKPITLHEIDKGRFVIKTQQYSGDMYGLSGSETFEMKSAYTHDGNYIGNVEDAEYICNTKGIHPQLVTEGNNTCSIGKSDKDGKWYGWSHRAMFGFKKGSVIKSGDIGFQEDRNFGASYILKSEEDAKNMAMLFAEDVS